MRPDQLIKDGKKVTCTIRHRSMQDVLTCIAAAKKRGKGSSLRKNDEGFHGTSNMEQYEDMLRYGWKAGVEGVEELDGLSTDASERLQFDRNVGGAFPIVPAHLAGHPNAMLQPVQRPVDSTRGLTLVIDSCFHAGVQSETVLEYAREVMKLIAWLQAEQIDTSVYAVVPIRLNQNRDKRVMYVTPIRQTGEVFQPERVAAILHPSWLRRAWFSQLEYDYYERGVKDASPCTGSYGTVTHANADEMREALPEAYSVILLPKIGTHDPARAIKEAVNLKLRRGADHV